MLTLVQRSNERRRILKVYWTYFWDKTQKHKITCCWLVWKWLESLPSPNPFQTMVSEVVPILLPPFHDGILISKWFYSIYSSWRLVFLKMRVPEIFRFVKKRRCFWKLDYFMPSITSLRGHFHLAMGTSIWKVQKSTGSFWRGTRTEHYRPWPRPLIGRLYSESKTNTLSFFPRIFLKTSNVLK